MGTGSESVVCIPSPPPCSPYSWGLTPSPPPRPDLDVHYYQGLHDIASVLLLVMGSEEQVGGKGGGGGGQGGGGAGEGRGLGGCTCFGWVGGGVGIWLWGGGLCVGGVGVFRLTPPPSCCPLPPCPGLPSPVPPGHWALA